MEKESDEQKTTNAFFYSQSVKRDVEPKPCIPFYKQNCLTITRRIPLDREIYPKNINPTTDRAYEQDCLEFCTQPRTIHELKSFLGMKNINQTYWRFVKPLIAEGKLNFTIPDDPDNMKQMYIKSGVEITAEIQDIINQKLKTKANIELERKVLEYCKEPRLLCEIAEHLGFAHSVCIKKRAIEPLLSEGKLILKYPEWREYQKQQFMTPDCAELQITTINILNFCQEPRYKNEITDYFDGSIKFARHFIQPMINSGELVYLMSVSRGKVIKTTQLIDCNKAPNIEMLKEEASRHKTRKPYKRNPKPRVLEKESKHIEWENQALEFCKIPRTQAEIIKQLGLPSYHLCRNRVIEPLLKQGKIRLMYLHNKQYQHQKYVVTEAETNLPFSDENIVEYCKVPRSKEDIENYFNISQHLCYKHVIPLVENGKLKYTKSTRIGNKIHKPKLIKAKT